MRVAWVFLCEAIEAGPSGEVVSMLRIIRPHSGFGARRLPLRLEPYFVVSLDDLEPGGTLTLTPSVSDGTKTMEIPSRTVRVPSSGMLEVAVPIGTLTFIEPGTWRWSLAIDGSNVYTVRAALDRLM